MTRAEQPVETPMDAPERRGEEAAPGKRQAVLASPADEPPAEVALEMGEEMDKEMEKVEDKELASCVSVWLTNQNYIFFCLTLDNKFNFS